MVGSIDLTQFFTSPHRHGATMRILATALILAAACGPAVQAGAPAAAPAATLASGPVAGSYVLRKINGHELPAASPTESNVELSRGVLQLDPQGTFSMTLTGRRNREPTPGDEQMRGSYTLTGDLLTLSISGGAGGGPSFHITRSGDTLTLRDDMGNAYTLVRQ
jgi:hypothetical protein